MENNSTQKPWLSKGGRKSRGPSRTGAQGICWCWHLPSLHLQAKTGDPVVCVCMCVWGGRQKGGWLCANMCNAYWPHLAPYVAETRRIAGYKVTLPVFTCVPAPYTSASRSSITAVYISVKIHLLDISDTQWSATTLNPPGGFNVVAEQESAWALWQVCGKLRCTLCSDTCQSGSALNFCHADPCPLQL